MNRNSNKRRSLLICLALTVVTAAVYCQVYNFEFLDYDDPNYVYENPNIRSGFTFKAVKWAFTSGYASNWHPLTWLSHILDWQLFGNNPAGHHITNLLFHVANTLLLFIILAQMTNALWPSAFAAALFALHPLHVESVAWVAERKDVLSTFFWLLTMWAYVRFVLAKRTPTTGVGAKRYYLLVIVFFALGLMSKPMLVTLPFVLLLLDYWPLERIGTKRSVVYLLIEKIPLFAMAIASSVITFIVQEKGGSMLPGENLSFVVRLANASISYLQYIIKMFWPAKLAVFYPHPGKDISFLFAVISAVILLAVTVIILRFSRNRRYLVTGWFWYLGALVPVIGIVQVGYQAMADRYTYITLTGLFIIISWGATEITEKWRHRKRVLRISATFILSILAVITSLQLRYWKDTITLSQHSLEVTEDNFKIHIGIAEAYLKRGGFEESILHNKEALRIIPQSLTAINNIGNALMRTGRIEDAVEYYKRAIDTDPCDSEAWLNLGYILIGQGKFDEAVSLCNKALKIKPDLHEIRVFLGLALVDNGKFAQAEKEYEDFLRLEPQSAIGHNDFGVVLCRQGEFDRAIEHFNRAIQIDPHYTRAKDNLNSALIGKQKLRPKGAVLGTPAVRHPADYGENTTK